MQEVALYTYCSLGKLYKLLPLGRGGDRLWAVERSRELSLDPLRKLSSLLLYGRQPVMVHNLNRINDQPQRKKNVGGDRCPREEWNLGRPHGKRNSTTLRHAPKQACSFRNFFKYISCYPYDY